MTTIVEDVQHIRKAMDSGPYGDDWLEIDQPTADHLMSNQRCRRDLWCNGEWYIADGYGKIIWHETKGDRWFVKPSFVVVEEAHEPS